MNKSDDIKATLTASALLGLVAVISAGVLLLVFDITSPTIEQSEKQYLLGQLHAIIKPHEHDNDIYRDTITIHDKNLLQTSKPVTAYRARKQGKPVAVLFTVIAPDGYNGNIKLLVGVYADASLAGVRVISHRETPGLGDDIEARRSDWILGFNGRSLDNTSQRQWQVKKDGGDFDQFTGATITPRAVIRAVQNALNYFELNRDQLFSYKTDKPHE